MKNGPKDWLKASYSTHGNSTSSNSKGDRRNMDDTPKAKVARIGAKTTDMAKTSTKGNSSGGGSVKQKTASLGNGGNVKTIAGIVGSRKQ
jgi:hypothetical protein